MFFTAGERFGGGVEFFGKPEIAGGLAGADADLLLPEAHVFETEGQLVPHLIGHDLLVGVLRDEADLVGGGRVAHVRRKADGPGERAEGRQLGLEQAQERCLAAAGIAAQQIKPAAFQREGYALQRGRFGFGVCKAQIFDRKQVHRMFSSVSIRKGKNASAPKQI